MGFKFDSYYNSSFVPPQNNNPGAQILYTDSLGFGCSKDSVVAPYGGFVETTNQLIHSFDGTLVDRWWAQDIAETAQSLNDADFNGKFHDFYMNYDSALKTVNISFTETNGNILTWSKKITNKMFFAFSITGATGGNTNLQQFQIEEFDFQEAATVNVKYVNNSGNTLANGNVAYPNGPFIGGTYTTEQKSITGYTFKKMDDGTATGEVSLPASGILTKLGDNGSVVYVYSPNNYQVKFNSNDETPTPISKTQNFEYNITQPLSANTFSKTGYSFFGWNTAPDGSGRYYYDKQSVKNLTAENNVTINLYAQWMANEQSVNFDPNGGSTEQKSITGKTDETVDLSPVKPATRSGYTFKGWYTSKDGDTKMPSSVKLPAGGITYYAQWTANEQILPKNGDGNNKNLYSLLGAGIFIIIVIILYFKGKNLA